MTYYSKAAKKKIEMFNEGGEIAIFKKTGLQLMFFGETIIGPKLPNLTYMLVFDDMATRDERWGTFGGDPDWKKLRANPAYKDTVSNITDIILRPARYSQIYLPGKRRGQVGYSMKTAEYQFCSSSSFRRVFKDRPS